MRRPFVYSGFASVTVLTLLFFTARADVAFTLLVTSVVCAMLSLIKRRRDFALLPVFLAVVLSCLLFLFSDAQRGRVQSFAGEGVRVEAVVKETPYKASDRNRHYAVCEIKKLNGEKASGRIRLSFSPSKDGVDPGSLSVGNRIAFAGTVYLPGAGEKDIERYFLGESILLGAYGLENLTVKEPKIRGINYYFQKLRDFMATEISKSFSDTVSGVLIGVLTGDSSYMDDETYEAFRKSGISHLMAVSGLHLSVWVFFIASILPDSSKVKYIILLVSTVFVMFLAGMSESVKRAGLMSLIYILGCLSERKSEGVNSLAFSVFLMTLFNPRCVLSLSFQLSVLSTLAILTLGQACIRSADSFFSYEGYRKSKAVKLLKICFDSLCISMSVLVFTFILQIYEFDGISAVSPLTNMLITLVATPLLILAGVFVLVSPLTFLAYPVSFVAKLLAEYVLRVSAFLSSQDSVFLSFEKSNAGSYFVVVAVVLLFYFTVFRKNFIRFFKRSFARRLYMCYNYMKYQSGGDGDGGI